MLYAVPVEATIASGRIRKLDTTAAEKMPGVRAIFHRENIGKIFHSALEPGMEGICEERRPAFEDDVVRYYGQYVALAVAETFENAKAAADAVCVTYEKDKPNVEAALEADLRRLAAGQHDDGGWTVDFPSSSPAATLEWRGYATVEAVQTLEAWG